MQGEAGVRAANKLLAQSHRKLWGVGSYGQKGEHVAELLAAGGFDSYYTEHDGIVYVAGLSPVVRERACGYLVNLGNAKS